MKVYPVIHYFDDNTTIQEAKIAKEYGADGVFLISHIGNDENLIYLAKKIKNDLNFRTGLNLLTFEQLHTANIVRANNIDMVWFDNCGVSSEGLNTLGQELSEFSIKNPNIEIYGSIAFKYQKHEPNPSLTAKIAYNAGFIPTTSGLATGKAPDINKMSSMFSENNILAVASGMNNDNISIFKNYLTHILVSTGISKDDFHFDRTLIKNFIEKAKS